MTTDKVQSGIQSNPICIEETVCMIYVVERMLASGKFPTVFVARAKNDAGQEHVALKVVPIGSGHSALLNEIAILKSVGGREHFTKLFGIGLHRQYKFLAMELLGPTLYDIIHRPQMQKLSLSSVIKIGIQCLEALSTLHRAGFVHGKVRSGRYI
ncbi:MAG: hypothetical protein EZS28_024006 [Streblomastix strix]|uniref:Protein kinase domain-containing protein n=1 Tax=Streblomastix strix TaxID=222440 RepID=A0A5J4VD48_9EUKA|nr:MAG: hypothetical protein EZS28_024006 [Streblomastix strix]